MTSINLKELIEQKIIKETDATRKLTIHEKTKSYKVYEIPIEYLHYNNKNGRIISSINRYESEGNVLDITDKEAYNNILQSYIIKNPILPRYKQQNRILNYSANACLVSF